jgi:hypothetical protein
MVNPNTSPPDVAEMLNAEYERQQALFSAQTVIVQRFLEAQAAHLAHALVEHTPQAKFTLPDRIVCDVAQIDQPVPMSIPQNQREHTVGSLLNRVRKSDISKDLRHALIALEGSPERAVSVATALLRHATVLHMVHNMLPAGRSVTYQTIDADDAIPSTPVGVDQEPESAITSASDAIVEEGRAEEGRGELLVPYVPYARKFYLPQWVAFDDRGKLLVGSAQEAEAHVKSMQRFMDVLFVAVAVSPYISADEEYQKKRYGMLGQLVNQGRALSLYKTNEIVQRIRKRADEGTLNRGLSLSLPYFDDQDLKLDVTNFEVIPAGRIMFVPAFVVRAVHDEQAKVSQDTRLNSSTRKHLLAELAVLERAFYTAPAE